MTKDWLLSDFDFNLPQELIAQAPTEKRTQARLLIDCQTQSTNQPFNSDAMNAAESVSIKPEVGIKDGSISDLLGLLQPNDCLVFNDTRVIRARLFGHKVNPDGTPGGKIELLFENSISPFLARCQMRVSNRPAAQQQIKLNDTDACIRVHSQDQQGCWLLESDLPWDDILEAAGTLPLPSYIRHQPSAKDAQRYQTVFARHPGAIAAPTAGLHFDEPLLKALANKGVSIAYVTLHVGSGTFTPIRTLRLADHQMHFERYDIPQATVDAIKRTRQLNGRVVAVGTTSLRALESASNFQGELSAGSGNTNLFIQPNYCFRCVDCLLTNFHLTQSSLLVLVSAFAGYERIRTLYAHAIAARYRFFSYGDAMWLNRKTL